MKSNRLFSEVFCFTDYSHDKKMPVMFLRGSKTELSQTLPQNLVSILLMQHFWALCVHVRNKTSNVYLESKQGLF